MGAREGLIGTRIRERRTIAGIRQADLARKVGISASYLNLIEHNRRRIGGKLLLDIAAALNVEPQTILEGAEAALIATLREAAEAGGLEASEAERAEEFAGRFPGWAEALAEAYRRINALERLVETLSDRIAHDPQLAASLHAVLTAAASIRATASILDETEDLDEALQRRFHANVHEDSRRLSESAKFLVTFLEADPDGAGSGSTPQEDVEAWLGTHGFCFDGIEDGTETPDAILAGTTGLSDPAEDMARTVLSQYARDAQRLPLQSLRDAVAEKGNDPARLAAHFSVPTPLLLRRLSALRDTATGFIIADRSGSILYRKPLDGFTIPRFGAACALLPLFQALTQPGLLVHTYLTQLGQSNMVFEAFAMAEPASAQVYNMPPLYHAAMLVRPTDLAEAPPGILETGVTCRVCPKADCAARREASILT